MSRRFEGPSWHLEKRGEQLYRAVAELGVDPDSGERTRKYRTFRGTRASARKSAEEWFDDLCRRFSEPDLVGRSEQPLSRFLQSWLDSKRGTIKESTWKRYDTMLQDSVVPALGRIRLCDLSAEHIRKYIAECRTEISPRSKGPDKDNPDRMREPIRPKTIQNRLGALSVALKQALREGLIPRNPLDVVDKPRVGKPNIRIVSEQEAASLRRASEGTDLETIVYLALATGAREGELLALRWGRDLDLKAGIMHITRTISEDTDKSSDRWYSFTDPKGGCARTLDLDSRTVEVLKRYRARQSELRLQIGQAWSDEDLIFPNTWQLRGVSPGSPLRVSTVSRQFRKLADSAALEGVRFHDLRHAHATIMLRAGVPVHVVSQRLGHKDIATTLRYYGHVVPGQQLDAATRASDAIQAALETG